MRPGACFFVNFVAAAFFLAFFIDFGSIFDEKTLKKKMCFFTGAFDFINLANPQVHRQGQCFEYFSLSSCFVFFAKNAAENRPKNEAAKVLVKGLSGRLFWYPKSIKCEHGGSAKSQKSRKIRFLEGPIFSSFFRSLFLPILEPK